MKKSRLPQNQPSILGQTPPAQILGFPPNPNTIADYSCLEVVSLIKAHFGFPKITLRQKGDCQRLQHLYKQPLPPLYRRCQRWQMLTLTHTQPHTGSKRLEKKKKKLTTKRSSAMNDLHPTPFLPFGTRM